MAHRRRYHLRRGREGRRWWSRGRRRLGRSREAPRRVAAALCRRLPRSREGGGEGAAGYHDGYRRAGTALASCGSGADAPTGREGAELGGGLCLDRQLLHAARGGLLRIHDQRHGRCGVAQRGRAAVARVRADEGAQHPKGSSVTAPVPHAAHRLLLSSAPPLFRVYPQCAHSPARCSWSSTV
jgi:hypothetical protein